MIRLLIIASTMAFASLMTACSTPAPYDAQPARDRADRAQQEMSNSIGR